MPTPLFGGMLVPADILGVVSGITDGNGAAALWTVPGGAGPASAFAQCVCLDPSSSTGFVFSNAIELALLP